MYRILHIGDVVGKTGRKAISALLPQIKEEYRIDFTVINGENSAGGSGITTKIFYQLKDLGADIVTTGNHIWNKPESSHMLEQHPDLLRPANYPSLSPGSGVFLTKSDFGPHIAIINLSGRTFMAPLDCPFQAIDKIINELKQQRRNPIIIVDFHAEATSEKQAMGYYLDGRVTAVLGTHTHVQTADEQILPNHTAYITDVGMTGSFDSILGVDKDAALQRFITMMPTKFEVAKKKPGINAVVVTIDNKTLQATAIERINKLVT